MKQTTIKLLSLVFIISLAINGKAQTTLDQEKVSTNKELNFNSTDKRGIKADDGIIYFVEPDGQTLTAYEKNNIRWTVNIIKACGELVVGESEIRYIKLIKDKIQIIFGKQDLASVDIKDGKVKYLGSD